MKPLLFLRISHLLPRKIRTYILIAGSIVALQVHGETVEVRPFEHAAAISLPPACRALRWVTWAETVEPDSLQPALTAAVKQLQQIDPSPGRFLTEALCHHLLYRTGNDANGKKASAIIDSLLRSGYRSSDLLFLKAVHLIWTGKATTGLFLLDSLKTSVAGHGDRFLGDYLKVMSRLFLPSSDVLQGTVSLTLDSPSGSFAAAPVGADEGVPSHLTWTLHESEPRGFTAGFTLSMRFNLTATPVLRIPMLVEPAVLSLAFSIDTAIYRDVPRPFIHDPFGYTSPMEIRIHVIPGRQLFSLYEHIYDIVKGRFDMVRVSDDIPQLKTAAVRCRNRSFFRDGNGTYHAFTAFDADIGTSGRSIRFSPAGGKIKKEKLPVRYLLTMEVSDIVEQKAEQVFQNILRSFGERVY
jgi:hypothetical protein